MEPVVVPGGDAPDGGVRVKEARSGSKVLEKIGRKLHVVLQENDVVVPFVEKQRVEDPLVVGSQIHGPGLSRSYYPWVVEDPREDVPIPLGHRSRRPMVSVQRHIDIHASRRGGRRVGCRGSSRDGEKRVQRPFEKGRAVESQHHSCRVG